jgi:release factor glutamine methyltransferase
MVDSRRTLKSILEVLQGGAAFLERKGVESARLNMEHLLAHALGLKRMDLYLQFDRPLSEEELVPLREWTARRAAGEPLQHLLGTVDFYRFTFKTDARGLIPRPETEELVEKIIDRCRLRPPTRVLDMGCGSGVIGLSLAAAFPAATVMLADFSADALSLARENAVLAAAQAAAEPAARGCLPLGETAAGGLLEEGADAVDAAESRRSGFTGRLTFVQTDLFSVWAGDVPAARFDVLAANLPYIPRAEVATLSREVQKDPVMALDGGEEGVELMERFIAMAPDYCAPGALVALEHGPDQGGRVAGLLARAGFEGIVVQCDLSGRERFTFGVAPK